MPEKVKSGFTPENILYTPEDIVYFISKLAAKWKPKKILDPACGSGSFFPEISSLMDENPHCTGVDIGSEIIKNADTKSLIMISLLLKMILRINLILYSVNHLLCSYKSQKMPQDLVCWI